MEEEYKKKILNIVRIIAGKNYHRGTFASLSSQYPSEYIKMSNEIIEEYTKLKKVLDAYGDIYA
jgi:hypothetical protein